jgi:hypothetical protein
MMTHDEWYRTYEGKGTPISIMLLSRKNLVNFLLKIVKFLRDIMNKLSRATMLAVAALLSVGKLKAAEKVIDELTPQIYTWDKIEKTPGITIRAPAVIKRNGYADVEITQGEVTFRPANEDDGKKSGDAPENNG